MTREELIAYGEDYLKDLISASCDISERHKEFVKMAIKALKQEPCEDAISRQAVIDIVRFEDKWLFDAQSNNTDTDIAFNGIISKVSSLSPVNPQPKTGHWSRVSMDKYVQHAMAYYRCSECGKDIIGEHNYCPNCGAKMVEREVEE